MKRNGSNLHLRGNLGRFDVSHSTYHSAVVVQTVISKTLPEYHSSYLAWYDFQCIASGPLRANPETVGFFRSLGVRH
jgi:hypothetical protein